MSSVCLQNEYGETISIRVTPTQRVLVSHSGWQAGKPGEFVDLGIPFGNTPRPGLLIIGSVEYRLTTADAACIRQAIGLLSEGEPAGPNGSNGG